MMHQGQQEVGAIWGAVVHLADSLAVTWFIFTMSCVSCISLFIYVLYYWILYLLKSFMFVLGLSVFGSSLINWSGQLLKVELA